MSPEAGAHAFVPVTRGDYPLLRRRRAEPHALAWWGSPDEEVALIEDEIDSGPADMRLVALADRPFAFVQDYPVDPDPPPQFAEASAGSRAVDSFLGEPAFHGRGHAAAYLRQRAGELLAAGAAVVLIDPAPGNERAVRCYRRAGFRDIAIRPCEDGDPVVVMQFSPA